MGANDRVDVFGPAATPEVVAGYKSQSARDAAASGYGKRDYWDYLDQAAQEHYTYFLTRGYPEKAKLMLTQSLSESLMGNDGD